ncbi:MAG: hypothetical protein ABI405_03515 [Parafilimonas sp.]
MPGFLHAQETKNLTKNTWSGSLAGYYYFIPGEEMYPTLISCADFKSLHLEARYNYEDINTASVFAGWTFGKDSKLSYSVTPMAGIAVGNSNGVLPGLECSATYSAINFYTENEYMFDFTGKENYFFYSWTQLSANTFKNMQAGVLAESLRWFKTKFNVQRGIYAEYSPGNFTFDIYGFNLFTSSDFFMASVTYQF